MDSSDQLLAIIGTVERSVNVFIEGTRPTLESLDLHAAVQLMVALDDLQERLAKPKAEITKLYDTLRFATIPGIMDGENLTTATIAGIGRVTVKDDVRVSDVDQERFQNWLVENGFEDLIKQTVNASTLAAFVRRRLKASEPLPTDMMKVTPFTRAEVTKL